ncbi:uncharacterized protein LOC135492486 [Lineus longissimus]|uniref:uncharacterized protein LOC135492486 n=1 Tax=Lineus longissimus TaxID=88925 RepID=UPI00315C9273
MVVNLNSMSIVPIVFLGVTILVILVCNVWFLRRISKNEHQCNRTLLWLGKFITVQSFLGGIFVTGIHMSSLIAGEWIFSEGVCQVYGVITHTWLASGVWTLVIANLERVSEVTSFVDHAVTFSVNNIKLLVLGMFMINAMICCFPLFGMAEYTTYRGKVSLYINITNTSFDNTTKEEMTSIYGKFINLKLLPSLNTFFEEYAARKTRN